LQSIINFIHGFCNDRNNESAPYVCRQNPTPYIDLVQRAEQEPWLGIALAEKFEPSVRVAGVRRLFSRIIDEGNQPINEPAHPRRIAKPLHNIHSTGLVHLGVKPEQPVIPTRQSSLEKGR
jgi:hypothetical protein